MYQHSQCCVGQGRKKAWVFFNACAYSLVSVWFLTNLSAGDGVQFWHCFGMYCPVVFSLSTLCAFSPQMCWSVCQLLLWGYCCSNRRPGSGHGDWSVTYHQRHEEYLSSSASSMVLGTSVFCHVLPTTYCQCSQVCALLSAEDHAGLLDLPKH